MRVCIEQEPEQSRASLGGGAKLKSNRNVSLLPLGPLLGDGETKRDAADNRNDDEVLEKDKIKNKNRLLRAKWKRGHPRSGHKQEGVSTARAL